MIAAGWLLAFLIVAAVVCFVVSSFLAMVAHDDRDTLAGVRSAAWLVGGFTYAVLAVILAWP